MIINVPEDELHRGQGAITNARYTITRANTTRNLSPGVGVPDTENRFKPHAPSPTGQLLRSKERSSGHMEHLGIINERSGCMYMNNGVTYHKSAIYM